jgi:uncharacterized membrane protein
MGWLILLRVCLSVTTNAVQKRLLLDRAGTYPTWILTYALMLLPATALAFLTGKQTTAQFWRDVAIGGGLDAFGNLAMIAALRTTDVSVFGPLNALRPILALLFGWFFLGESPTGLGVVGVAITAVGGVVLRISQARCHPGECRGDRGWMDCVRPCGSDRERGSSSAATIARPGECVKSPLERACCPHSLLFDDAMADHSDFSGNASRVFVCLFSAGDDSPGVRGPRVFPGAILRPPFRCGLNHGHG